MSPSIMFRLHQLTNRVQTLKGEGAAEGEWSPALPRSLPFRRLHQTSAFIDWMLEFVYRMNSGIDESEHHVPASPAHQSSANTQRARVQTSEAARLVECSAQCLRWDHLNRAALIAERKVWMWLKMLSNHEAAFPG